MSDPVLARDPDVEGDALKDHCGIVGFYARSGAISPARAAYFGLYSLQHRGQEAAGITVHDVTRGTTRTHRGVGLVSRIFDEAVLDGLQGDVSIGHVRYATHGTSCLANAQPFTVRCRLGQLALAHNGNLVNADSLVTELEREGSIFQSGLDTEVICHLLSRSRAATFEEALRESLLRVRGAYSLTLLLDGVLYAIRDPSGFRPLVMGRLGPSTVLASETCALDLLGAEFVRELDPGELIRVDGAGETSLRLLHPAPPSPCVFELVYFARPDSTVFGQNAYLARTRMGQELARESPVPADLVIPVPDSGVSAALGFSQESGIPYAMGLTRNHYIGRTFIDPGQVERELKLKVKLNPIPEVIRGKEIIVIDDSIVRGTTSRQLMKMLWQVGPRAIHLRISSPPIRHPCLFGIDTPDRDQLIAASKSSEEIRDYLGVSTLAYLSMDGLMRAVTRPGAERFCRACFDGRYPVEGDAAWPRLATTGGAAAAPPLATAGERP